ncbi:MAG: AAA family ATPase [Gammaproteobacteria bacterium]|nr:AAA family ATPase [Gammaproteobacteria bacterium]MCW8987989.1 AAA family ATPase [Gammaproteobacteria bacterium]MCW9030867.1 AAA family ATPase [Gammaproteobacteria bacterium]
MTQIKAINAQQLRSFCSQAEFDFKTTNDLPDFEGIVGQERAIEALSFAVEIDRPGYNMYLMGSTGLGKHTLLKRFLDEAATKKSSADDWCYVFNFDNPQNPKAIHLPAGEGREFRDDMRRLVQDLQAAIPSAFETEQYYTRQQEVRDSMQAKTREAFNSLAEEAKQHNVILLRHDEDLTFAPVKDDKELSPEEYEKLSEKDKSQYEEVISVLEERLNNLIRQRTLWQKEAREKISEINREVGMFAAAHLIEEVKVRYKNIKEITNYLMDVQEDVINSLYDFREYEHTETELPVEGGEEYYGFQHYEVNLIVDNKEKPDQNHGCPVIYEDNPMYQNLLGRVEYVSQMGTQVTDYRFIKSGALHKANGGYLIIDAHKLLSQPYSWEALKRVLVAKEITIQSLGDAVGLLNTVSLEPEPIPLDVKVVLVGGRSLYYLLEDEDPEFAELFKVEVDFSESIDCSKESLNQYAQVIATLIRKNNLTAFDQSAVQRVIEYGMRQIEDTTQLSTHMHSMVDLLIESDHWAKKEKQAVVRRADVQLAIDKQIYRADRSRDRIYDEIKKGIIMIDVSGEKIATVNGLFVIETGRIEFSQPARITATVRIGDGDIIDIEREVDLGGAIHSKGVLILSSYLGAHYATGKPLSLAASLVFEQSYGNVDGDSATVGELCALVSAISKIPVKQSFAITGSADQHGNVQAIGGINEKIEGFFDVCKLKGLTGEQGVIIPASNVAHLILRDDVVDAIENKQFSIYPVNIVDEAISLLTGLPAGERNAEGEFPEESVNYKVEQRLLEMAELKHEDQHKDEHEHENACHEESKESKKDK